jgi:hypothetical protein
LLEGLSSEDEVAAVSTTRVDKFHNFFGYFVERYFTFEFVGLRVLQAFLSFINVIFPNNGFIVAEVSDLGS